MRIVMPYNTHFGEFSADKMVGGIEKFCHQIFNTFDDVHIINIDNSEPIKYNTTKIKSFAKDICADVIISNWHQASFAGAKICDSEVPVMFVCHGNNGLRSILNTFKNLAKNDHSCYLVSSYQHEFYNLMCNRFDTEIQIDGYINSSYVEGDKPKMQDIVYDCVTIGRCDPYEKKPFIMKELLGDTKYKNVLMTNSPKDEKEHKYLEKNSHWNDVLMNLPHKEVMNHLSRSMTYFSTCWNETWGITAMEALSHGVPIILNTRNGIHASMSVAASDKHYVAIERNTNDLVSAIESFRNVDRKEIQDMTWEEHSHSKWKNDFANSIDRVVEKFKKPTLEEFI